MTSIEQQILASLQANESNKSKVSMNICSAHLLELLNVVDTLIVDLYVPLGQLFEATNWKCWE